MECIIIIIIIIIIVIIQIIIDLVKRLRINNVVMSTVSQQLGSILGMTRISKLDCLIYDMLFTKKEEAKPEYAVGLYWLKTIYITLNILIPSPHSIYFILSLENDAMATSKRCVKLSH